MGGVSVQDFNTRSNKLREAISTISRSLNSTPLSGKDYELFASQEECLKKISNALNILKPSVEEMGYLADSTLRTLKKEQAEQIKRLIEKLRDDWLNVNRQYTERHNRWVKCYEKWKNLHNACWNVFEKLDKLHDTLSNKLNEAANTKEVRSIIQKMEQEMNTNIQWTMKNIASANNEISNRASLEDIADLQNTVDNVTRRWQNFITDFNAQKEK